MTIFPEFSASEIRQVLQGLFPHRRLVLSQFTFFNNIGVSLPTGETFRRGRRCYRLEDILSIATVLALKEEGIPLKNIGDSPKVIRECSEKIFSAGPGVRLSGHGASVQLNFPGQHEYSESFIEFLLNTDKPSFFWSFDVGALAVQLRDVATAYVQGTDVKTAREQSLIEETAALPKVAVA